MHELLILVTALAIVLSAWRVLVQTRDPLAPMVVFAPMLLYMFVYNPWTRLSSPTIASLFPNRDDLLIVFWVLAAGVCTFCLGLSWDRVSRNAPDRRFELMPYGISPTVRQKLFQIALLMGVAANSAHAFMIWYSGGWAKVFSESKPFLRGPSGYVGELPILVYPALLLLACAWQGRRITPPRLALFLAISFPQLTMATFGGRRGPMFLVVCTFVACWCIVRSRRPKLKTILVGGVLLGLLLILLGGNRNQLFKPWENDVDYSVVTDQLGTASHVTTGDEFVAASAMVIGSNELDRHYWGVRYFTTFVIRPVPAFIWPTKYHDLGMGWMPDAPGSSGITPSEWLSVVGFVPASGNAGGFIPDLFLEFSWGAVIFCFLIGRMYSSCWRRWRTQGGVWVMLYFELLILSVYLPSQSVGAWMYRLMLLSVPTWLIWKRIIEPGSRRQSRAVTVAPVRRYQATRT